MKRWNATWHRYYGGVYWEESYMGGERGTIKSESIKYDGVLYRAVAWDDYGLRLMKESEIAPG